IDVPAMGKKRGASRITNEMLKSIMSRWTKRYHPTGSPPPLSDLLRRPSCEHHVFRDYLVQHPGLIPAATSPLAPLLRGVGHLSRPAVSVLPQTTLLTSPETTRAQENVMEYGHSVKTVITDKKAVGHVLNNTHMYWKPEE
ncbi:14239_t:CDS:2, partial [Acaulospora colombiana]